MKFGKREPMHGLTDCSADGDLVFVASVEDYVSNGSVFRESLHPRNREVEIMSAIRGQPSPCQKTWAGMVSQLKSGRRFQWRLCIQSDGRSLY
jgi:hypothetical protein